VVQTGQPYVFTNDNPLNATDPLGLKGWYCIDGESHYYKGDKYGAPTGKCGSAKDKAAEKTAVTNYVSDANLASAGLNGTQNLFIQGCITGFGLSLCVSGTIYQGAYVSPGAGITSPGASIGVGSGDGISAGDTISGYTTCEDVSAASPGMPVGVGVTHCNNEPGNGSSNTVVISTEPGQSVYQSYGYRIP
jgi:hypothetical protein